MYIYPLRHEGTPLGECGPVWSTIYLIITPLYTIFSALMVLLGMKGAVRLHR